MYLVLPVSRWVRSAAEGRLVDWSPLQASSSPDSYSSAASAAGWAPATEAWYDLRCPHCTSHAEAASQHRDAEWHGVDPNPQAKDTLPCSRTTSQDARRRGVPDWSYLGLRELLLQLLYFLAQLPDDLGVGVLVHDGMVNDPFGSICVS